MSIQKSPQFYSFIYRTWLEVIHKNECREAGFFFRQGQAVACSKLPLWAWLQPLSNCNITVGSQKALMIPSWGPPRARDLCVCLWVCLVMYLCRSAEDTSLSELNYLLQVRVWQKLLRPRRQEGKLYGSALISVRFNPLETHPTQSNICHFHPTGRHFIPRQPLKGTVHPEINSTYISSLHCSQYAIHLYHKSIQIIISDLHCVSAV